MENVKTVAEPGASEPTPAGVARPHLRGLAGQIGLNAVPEPPRGCPFGGGGVHRFWGYGGINPYLVIHSAFLSFQKRIIII